MGTDFRNNKDVSDSARFAQSDVQIECDPDCTATKSSEYRVESWSARFVRKSVDNPLALFTGILVLATLALAVYTAVVARATRFAAEHIPRVERAYISGGGGPPPNNNGTLFRFDINNFGKRQETSLKFGGRFAPQLQYPVAPRYGAPHFYYDWIKPDDWRPGIHVINVPPNIPDPVIYGRYYYRDVFNKSHSTGFILQIHSNGGSTPIRAPAIYTEERDEPDPDDNLSYRA